MGGFWVSAGSVLLVSLSACGTTSRMDLADNDKLYRLTGYQAQVAVDRGVFVPPVVDQRTGQPAEAAGAVPIEYFPDSRWDRSVAEMVDAIVRREVAASGVFAAVLEHAKPDACLLRVSIKRFEVGTETHVTGWRSLAAVALQAQVYGPEGADGQRPLWLDRTLPGQVRSDIDWRPPPGAVLAGMSLRQAVGTLLANIDQSNVARTNVPLEIK